MYEDLKLTLDQDEVLESEIVQDEEIGTSIETDEDLELSIGSEIPIDVSFRTEADLELTINEGGSGLPYYEGPYIVDPRKVEQSLETQNKSMSSNVIVNAINYSETSNPQGGNTVVIGYE